jgi:hypothetical protein
MNLLFNTKDSQSNCSYEKDFQKSENFVKSFLGR